MNELERDIQFLRLAYLVASNHSMDPYVQNGAILVKNNQVISFGANRFPDRVKESEERWKYPLKSFFVSHAEENAITNAAKTGVSTDGSTMYCPWFACDRCANMIINAGIVRVVGHSGPDRWHERHREYKNGNMMKSRWDESIDYAIIKMQEAGIKLHWLDEEIRGVSIIFMGEKVYP